MITRALLRTKAAQVLYAGFQAHNDLKTIDNELIFCINKYYDLYHFLFLLPLEIVKMEQKSIQISTKKHLKTKTDLNPNEKLAENLYAAQLAKNQNLSDYAEKMGLSWLPYQKEASRIFNILKEQDFYTKYMESKEKSFAEDKSFWMDFFKSDIIFDENFDEFLEEISIYWLDDVSLARSLVVKTINKHRRNENKNDKFLPLFKDQEDKRFVRELVRAVVDNNGTYTLLIDKFLRNWQVDRLTKIDIILLKMAIAELKLFPIIPVSVTMNEYIEISKFYGTNKSSTFINGVLDNIVKRMQDTGTLYKIDEENKKIETETGNETENENEPEIELEN
jgi:N utilization substance protein B